MLVRNEQEVSSVHSGLFFIVYGSFIKEKVGPGVQRLFGHNLRADLLFHWLGCIYASLSDYYRGVTGIAAIIYYATGHRDSGLLFVINAIFLGFALKILGPKFSIKTIFAIFMLTFPALVLSDDFEG